jgi:hypothetical protein
MDSLGNIIAEKQDVDFKQDVVLDRIFSKCDKKELDKLLAEREQEILRARDAEYFETIKRLKEKSNNDCIDER